MKLESKQLALLAAHEVNTVVIGEEGSYNVSTISHIDFNNEIFALNSGWGYEFDDLGKEVFMRLRPFSSITKEIDHGGRIFVPVIEFIKQNFKLDEKLKLEILNMSLETIRVGYLVKGYKISWDVPIHKDSISNKLLNYCLNLHIDMFGFIESKLAVEYDKFNKVTS